MKRIVALILTLVMLCVATSSLAAEEFNISTFSAYPAIFQIDVDSANGLAYIETQMSIAELAFVHKYDSDFYYSTISSDVIVLDYYKSSRFPVLRTWITYHADKPLNIYAVAFVLDGKTYTFSDVASGDRVRQLENGWQEKLLIRYGKNNSEFCAAVAAKALMYASAMYVDDDPNAAAPEMKMILYGTETVEVDVPAGFWIDYSTIFIALMNDDALSFIGENDGTPCKIK